MERCANAMCCARRRRSRWRPVWTAIASGRLRWRAITVMPRSRAEGERGEGSMAMTRRDAARKLFSFLAGSPLLRAQGPPRNLDRLLAMEELNNVMEFESIAHAHMLKSAYDYISGGVDDEFTLRRNRSQFER